GAGSPRPTSCSSSPRTPATTVRPSGRRSSAASRRRRASAKATRSTSRSSPTRSISSTRGRATRSSRTSRARRKLIRAGYGRAASPACRVDESRATGLRAVDADSRRSDGRSLTPFSLQEARDPRASCARGKSEDMGQHHDDSIAIACFLAPDGALVAEVDLTGRGVTATRQAVRRARALGAEKLWVQGEVVDDAARFVRRGFYARLEAPVPPAPVELARPPAGLVRSIQRACYADVWGPPRGGRPRGGRDLRRPARTGTVGRHLRGRPGESLDRRPRRRPAAAHPRPVRAARPRGSRASPCRARPPRIVGRFTADARDVRRARVRDRPARPGLGARPARSRLG